MELNKSNTTLIRRIQKDYADCKENGIDIEINEENDMTKWICYIYGPTDSEYEGGIFKLSVLFGARYPYNSPTINFINQVYHPNISTCGSICLDILKDKWSPALSLYKVLLSIQSLLTDPNPDSPLNSDAAHLYRTNKKEYHNKCQKLINEQNNIDNNMIKLVL